MNIDKKIKIERKKIRKDCKTKRKENLREKYVCKNRTRENQKWGEEGERQKGEGREREWWGGDGDKSRIQSEVNGGRKQSDGDSTNQNWKHFSCEATAKFA